jgi:type IV pilus assembly protein PilA
MSNKKGFTLIELLIVVVIIGILAAIAIPKFAKTKEKAYVAAMKSDLRNLATYEEQYAADNNGAYFADNAVGPAAMAGPGVGFTPSKDVTITATTPTTSTWQATATHAQLSSPLVTCTMIGGVIAGC